MSLFGRALARSPSWAAPYDDTALNQEPCVTIVERHHGKHHRGARRNRDREVARLGVGPIRRSTRGVPPSSSGDVVCAVETTSLASRCCAAVACDASALGKTQVEHRRKGIAMTSEWQYQVRFDLNDTATAESARLRIHDPALAPLVNILARHRASLKCQFDAFAEYVAAAEEHGVENYPLYEWTKATIENAEKKQKYLKSFTLYVDDHEVYTKEIADALEADLQPFARSGLITRISKYDTNPANNPQPPERPRNPS
jgi:hypothetical protein